MQAVSEAGEILDGKFSVLDALAEAKSRIETASRYDAGLSENAEMLETCWLTVEECHKNLLDYLENSEFDAERSAYVEQRLDLWYKLQKKYGADYDAINGYLEKIKQEAGQLQEIDRSIAVKNKELLKKQAELKELAGKLTELRKKYAGMLTGEITKHIADLAMPQGKFTIQFAVKEDFGKTGCDDMVFMFSANAGEPLMELTKVASGGELSRIMLAIKTILADRDETETLIFDEIDTGISGRTAQKISEKMAQIGQRHQVICITHLPQIAAMADSHFEIEKNVEENETVTSIHPLSEEDSVRELARMLGGAKITDSVLANASEMKELAQVQKSARLK